MIPNTPYENCNDCKGTGLIETQGLIFGRMQYDKALKKVITPYYGDNNWQKTQCSCVGEYVCVGENQ